MPTEDTLNFLWNCGITLSPDNHAQKLLKSYYINNCRQYAVNQMQLPANNFAASRMCPYCSTFWSEGDLSLKLLPQHIVRSAKAKRLIAKLEESKRSEKRLLTKKQRCRAKWLKKRITSNMEVSCHFCQHKTLLPLDKPKKYSNNAVCHDVEPAEEVEVVVPKAKKKKKKRDKTAGLRIPNAAPKQPNTVKTNSAPTPQTTHSLKSQKAPPTPQPNALLKQTLKSKKQKQKAPLIAPKIKSKTQKQNTLLQLATMLKTQAAKPATNTAQKRLDALLK